MLTKTHAVEQHLMAVATHTSTHRVDSEHENQTKIISNKCRLAGLNRIEAVKKVLVRRSFENQRVWKKAEKIERKLNRRDVVEHK